MVLSNKRQLGGEYEIFFLLREHVELIQVIVEGWLVRNDQVLAGSGRALEHVHGSHHRYRNSGDGFVRVSCLECIHSFRLPGHADMGLYPADDFARGEMLFLAGGKCAEEQEGEGSSQAAL